MTCTQGLDQGIGTQLKVYARTRTFIDSSYLRFKGGKYEFASRNEILSNVHVSGICFSSNLNV